ncbi:MAG: T9SS type A sorting domain-containing protein, partial [Chitinophagales bacterium]|nr:T9SS type A sorting domain-containing protein [Chitinophagales bacterium]
YTAGEAIGPFAEWWTTWSGTEGGAEDGTVSTDYAVTGANSMLIPEGGITDVILKLGNLTSGNYRLEWNMYIPSGKTGYYNIQESETPGIAWNFEVMFGIATSGDGYISIPVDGGDFTYPTDTWFLVEHLINLDDDQIVYYANGTLVAVLPYAGSLGAIDFYSIDANNRYYVDDVLLIAETPVIFNTYYLDSDGDTYGDIENSILVEGSAPTDYVENSDDCDDSDPAVYPGATELDNNIDDDCDGLIDEGVAIENSPSAWLNVDVYPVPSDGNFTLHITNNGFVQETGILEIYNSAGQLVYTDSVISGGMETIRQINIDKCASGVYLLKITTGNSVSLKQIIIEKV